MIGQVDKEIHMLVQINNECYMLDQVFYIILGSNQINLLLKLHYAYLTQGLYYHGFTYQKSAYVGFIFHTIAPISAISHFKG